MKKSFYYLATLLLSASLLSACSDDENEKWKELPTTPINIDGTNATVTVNNETSTSGSVTFKARNDQEATLILSDVVAGYPSLTMDVTMVPATAGYTFSGSTTVNTAPKTKAVSADLALLNVDVNGTISTDGKLSITLVAYGPGLNLGTYTGSILSLTYSGADMLGKTVYYTVSGSTPILTLADIVPGESSVVFESVYTDSNGAFECNTTTAAGATVTVNGKVETANGMKLAVNVTMPDALGLAGKYGFAAITNETEDDAWEDEEMREEFGFGDKFPTTSACYIRIEDDDDWTHGFAYLFRPLLGVILPQSLGNVTLSADGNILASYSNDVIQVPQPEDQSMFMEYYMYGTVTQNMLDGYLAGRSYKDSPKNLAFWFVQEGKLMVKLNISAIVSQVLSDKGIENGSGITALIEQILGGLSASELKALLGSDIVAGLLGNNAAILTGILNDVSDEELETLLGYVKNGFPLNLKQVNGHTCLYLDKKIMDVVVRVFSDAELLKVLGTALPAEYQQAMVLIETFLGSYADMTEFEIGLDLVK